MSIIKELLQKRKESGFLIGKQDLVSTYSQIFPPSTSIRGKSVEVDLQGAGEFYSNIPNFSIRSRFAQVGLDFVGIYKKSENLFTGRFLNRGPKVITIDKMTPLGSFYEPSLPSVGINLVNLVENNIEVVNNQIVFADIFGRQIKNTSEIDKIALIGVPINFDEFYEVDKDIDTVTLSLDQHVRVAVSNFLKPIQTDQSNHSFAVTSTVPISISDAYLTLITHFYEPLYHLSSVVIKPNSAWETQQGNHSGIRCEFFSTNNSPIKRTDLPSHVFFAAHEDV